MKRFLLIACVLAGSLLALNVSAAEAQNRPARRPARGPIVHVVSFKFKADAGAEKIKEVEQAFAALKQKIPQIVSYEWGTNISPEKLNKGFTHAFVLTFRNTADRDAYLVDPAHKAFGASLGPILDDVFVVDFDARHE